MVTGLCWPPHSTPRITCPGDNTLSFYHHPPALQQVTGGYKVLFGLWTKLPIWIQTEHWHCMSIPGCHHLTNHSPHILTMIIFKDASQMLSCLSVSISTLWVFVLNSHFIVLSLGTCHEDSVVERGTNMELYWHWKRTDAGPALGIVNEDLTWVKGVMIIIATSHKEDIVTISISEVSTTMEPPAMIHIRQVITASRRIVPSQIVSRDFYSSLAN